MKLTALKWWDRLHSSFWFVPTMMGAGAVALAYASVAVDASLADYWLKELNWLKGGGAQGAGDVLGTIASSMITITGVVFSMTLVALSLASSQLGPRLLRNFMADTVNQVVLGTFIATFLYALVVLRAIRHADEALFVPHVSVSLAMLLAVASLGVLVYFIHHVALSIQANHAVTQIGEELAERVDDLFPAAVGKANGLSTQATELSVEDAQPVLATADGYLQLIDVEGLMAYATAHDLRIRLLYHAGHFVIQGAPLALAWPATRIDTFKRARIGEAFVLGGSRSPVQDVEFALNQLVEVAVRALSPGINDPYTALACVDRLGAALSLLAQREMPAANRFDKHHTLRLQMSAVRFADLVDVAFNQIRQYGRGSAAVTIRMLESIAAIAPFTDAAKQREALERQAQMIHRGSREGLPEPNDRADVDRRFSRALMALEAAEGSRRGAAAKQRLSA